MIATFWTIPTIERQDRPRIFNPPSRFLGIRCALDRVLAQYGHSADRISYDSESFPDHNNTFFHCKIKIWKNLRTLILHWKQHLMKNLTWEIDSPRRLGMSRYQFCCKTPVGHASMDDKVISRFWTIFWKKWFKSYILTARCVARKHFSFIFDHKKCIPFQQATGRKPQGSNKPSRRTSQNIF